jgi:hypothetical protein
MAMVCPQCNGAFEQRWHCPSCGVRLIYQSHETRIRPTLAEGIGRWQQTPWGRIFVGLLLAQGLYYSLRHLCTAGILAAGDNSSRGVWDTLYGLVLLQGLQGAALLVGGMLTGAGKRQGAFFGAVVGVWNGVISILVASSTSQVLTPVALYGQPILQTAFGAVGGFLGSLIWRPLPVVLGAGDSRPAPVLLTSKKRESIFDGPVAWGRVLTGVAVAAGGTIWAKVILELVLEGSEGKLTIDSHLQAELVTWEVTALAMILGGSLAGATTRNGLKQGLFVGLGVAAVNAALRFESAQFRLEPVLFPTFAAVALGLVGGWFGGQLFPPVLHLTRPKNTGPTAW